MVFSCATIGGFESVVQPNGVHEDKQVWRSIKVTNSECARLRKSMYGTQDASSIWQETYSKLLRENVVQGVATPGSYAMGATSLC